MHEIGGEFWNVPMCAQATHVFPETTQWFLAGRSALQAVIQELKGVRSVSLPSWCCRSMIKPFADAGYTVRFYPVFFDGGLKQEIAFDSDVLLLMDYFGYTGQPPNLEGYTGIVIRDVTHSLFSSPYADADYSFGSLRKWCGVWTGGYAWSKDGHRVLPRASDDRGYASLREKAMQLKTSYIHGRGVRDKGYLQLFEQAEDQLEKAGIVAAADRDVWAAQRIDGARIREARRKNAAVLIEAFPDWRILSDMKETDCPLFVPVLIPAGKRDGLRRFLAQHEIYCPVHWPLSEYHRLDQKTAWFYQTELSLVCDQRYTERDMYRMVETIKQFMER